MKHKDLDRHYTIQKSLSKQFEQYMSRHITLYDNLVKIVNKLSSNKIPLILDVGCGPGILLERIHKSIPKASVIGLDSSKEMIRNAKKRVYMSRKNKQYLLIGTSESIPLNNEIVDVVISRFSECYWSNLQKSLQEIHRILKPDGFVVFEVLNKDYSRLKLLLIKFNMFVHHSSVEVIRYHAEAFSIAYGYEEFLNHLRNQSFTIYDTLKKKNDWRFMVIAQKTMP
jgi:ubiquinone/menaquinone biosynthesis C-methylase UbiE